jgi:hypothetical protein
VGGSGVVNTIGTALGRWIVEYGKASGGWWDGGGGHRLWTVVDAIAGQTVERYD